MNTAGRRARNVRVSGDIAMANRNAAMHQITTCAKREMEENTSDTQSIKGEESESRLAGRSQQCAPNMHPDPLRILF